MNLKKRASNFNPILLFEIERLYNKSNNVDC